MSKFWITISWLVIVYLWQEFTWRIVVGSVKQHWENLKRAALKGRKLRVSNKKNKFFGRVELE
jgi:hypothetical protein